MNNNPSAGSAAEVEVGGVVGRTVAQLAWTVTEDVYRLPLGRLIAARPLALTSIYIALCLLDIRISCDFAEASTIFSRLDNYNNINIIIT